MIPISCSNCWHNALQYGSIGLPVGYCTRHKRILNRSEELTCGWHIRKDLTLASANQQSSLHRERFGDAIVLLRTRCPANGEVASDDGRDLERLRGDDVGDAVADYGQLDAKIESLAQLRRLRGARAELAMLSLARSYVHNCVQRHGGSWTSGIHLFWWTKQRLDEDPGVGVGDLLNASSLPLDRRVELASWTLVMLRLTFIADVASHASPVRHPVAGLVSLPDEAALAADSFNLRKLRTWIRRTALKKVDQALPPDEYQALSLELHRPSEQQVDHHEPEKAGPWVRAPDR